MLGLIFCVDAICVINGKWRTFVDHVLSDLLCFINESNCSHKYLLIVSGCNSRSAAGCNSPTLHPPKERSRQSVRIRRSFDHIQPSQTYTKYTSSATVVWSYPVRTFLFVDYIFLLAVRSLLWRRTHKSIHMGHKRPAGLQLPMRTVSNVHERSVIVVMYQK